MRQHVVQSYLTFSREAGFSPLPRALPLRILIAIKPSHRCALSGLDNTTADGLHGFEMLHTILEDLKLEYDGKNELAHALDANKQYLKIEYKVHCESDKSPCVTHTVVNLH